MSTRQPRRQAQILKGMRDFLPERMIPRQHVIATLRDVFELHGFEPIDTPSLEYYETLAGKYGEDEKLIYHFADHGGREIGLRYDLTVPLARFIAVHRNELTFPFKRYHIGPVWRADRPQKGRYREFWQCDADIVGTTSMLADADIVSIVIEALQAIRMPNFVVHINHRKLLESVALYAGVSADRAGYVYRAIDKLSKIGPSGVAGELVSAGVEAATASRIVDLVSTSGPPDEVLSLVARRLEGNALAAEALADLDSLFNYLAALNADPRHYVFDLALARGLEYYTGPVFETTVDEPKIGSLGGAGRYDGLVGMFSGQDIPATGMSLGLERIIDVAEELGLLDLSSSVSDVLITVFDREHAAPSLSVASELRSAGVRAEVFLEDGRDLSRQLRFASKRGIPFAIVIGPDELERGVVSVRDMTTGQQSEVARDGAAQYLLSHVRQPNLTSNSKDAKP
ncbi:MAG TPA: histidine--tRNA ligase [Thermomicrobiales bacterium]|nr:histidine--tRNA ligase [Thermomicrobiales bacterium]